MKLSLGFLAITIMCLASVLTNSASKYSPKKLRNLAKLVHSLHITRHLQEKKPAEPAAEKKHTPIKLPPTNHFASWKKERDAFYEKEKERLAAQTRFHNSEFKRYVLQEEMNEKRKKITDDDGKSILDRRNEVKELQDDYKATIAREDVTINHFQGLRNPANQEASRAWSKFWQAYEKSNTEREAVKRDLKPDVTTRRLQALAASYTDAQKGQISALKAAWKKQYDTLKTSYTLNKKFHTVEFVEFQIDMNRWADMQVIWEDPKMSLWEKRTVWNEVDKQYKAKRTEAKNVINKANKTRQAAQNLVRGVDGEVEKVARAAQWFKWATKAGSG